jgi:hypothetical protein
MRRAAIAVLLLIWAVARAGAVEFGWQALGGGGIEYIVQVEPDLIDSFRQEGFSSEVPAGLRDIRRIRIEVGSGKLPNQGDMTGPTVAQAAPPAAVRSTTEPNRPVPNTTAPPETFGQSQSKGPSSADETAGGSASAPPPLLDSSHPIPPLPFFQSGPVKNISSNQLAAEERTPQEGGAKLPLKERPAIAAPKERALDRQKVEAGMPTAVESPDDGQGNAAGPSRAAAKPWGILVVALVGLFASLGANVYLVWIHQGVRAKYRTLAAQMGAGVGG